MITAAGILFQSVNGRVLFLKRGNGGDHADEWCFPGGHQEPGETLADCAIREALEETGYQVEVLAAPFTRRLAKTAPAPGATDLAGIPAEGVAAAAQEEPEAVDFTTYRVQGCPEFTPVLNDEHTAYAWALPSAPPLPLHPGCAVALARLRANELAVARMVAAGDLVSPTRFENITIYAMRMSGTGVSYRKGINEFVWRDPKIWVSQDMVDRCAGVPVIFEHPKRATLNSEEFADRVVGTVMFGYIKDDELWCVTRIYDDEVIKLLEEDQMSTSPSVLFRDPEVNTKLKLDDGTPLLIEGVPTLLDHLAICVKGVWDKGGDAAGIDQADVKADAEVVVLPAKRNDWSKLDEMTRKSSLVKIQMRSVASRYGA